VIRWRVRPGVGLQARTWCRTRDSPDTRDAPESAVPQRYSDMNPPPKSGLSRRARCAGERVPRGLSGTYVPSTIQLLQTRAMRQRAWPSASQRRGEPADVEAVHDLGPNAVESVGGNALAPRLSPRGLADTHVSSKSGFSRRARCAGGRGLAWASRHARYRRAGAQTRVTRRDAWPSASQRREKPADAKAVRDLGTHTVESAGGHARVPRLSPLGLADMHVSSKSGFTRRAR